jgi:single-strand DNA-binding protein
MKMAQDNQVMIVGNVTRDPELRYTPNGAALVKFGVAVSRRVRDESGQWKDADTSFFDVTAWRTLAENVAESITQGSRVVVVGRLRTNSWETPE